MCSFNHRLLLFFFILSLSGCHQSYQACCADVEFDLSVNGRTVTLEWNPTVGTTYDIWKSVFGKGFQKISSNLDGGKFVDRLDGPESTFFIYRLGIHGADMNNSVVVKNEKSCRLRSNGYDAILNIVQKATLGYFYDFAHPLCKMVRERSNRSLDIVTTGGSGFGIMALICGANRGFITRDEAFGHIRSMVDFLMGVPKFKGAFAHWYDGNKGTVVPFSSKDNGGDLVETSFLFQDLVVGKIGACCYNI